MATKSQKIKFEKRLYIGIFINDGIDFSDLVKIAQRVKDDFESAMSPLKFNISVDEGVDEGEPKIKIEAKDDSIGMWANEDMIFFSSYDNDGKGLMQSRYEQIISLIQLEVFNDITVTGFRLSVRAAVELDRSAEELKSLMKTIVNSESDDGTTPYAVSNQYTVRLDAEHKVEHKVVLSELDDTDMSEFMHTILHTVHYEKASKVNKEKMLKTLKAINPEEEIDHEAERSRKAISI